MVRGLFFTFVLLCFAMPASAQTAVLFPVGGDAELAANHGAEVLGRVQRDFEDSSFTVLVGDSLARAVAEAHVSECNDPSCAGALLTGLHADIGVGVALWRRNGLVQVSVVLVDGHDQQVSASADGAEGVLGQATQAALSQARARWATRGGAPVRVAGAPDGATITVDREPWGTLPHEGTLSPGTHHFVVSADGHTTERRDVEVPAATEALTLTFDLPVGAETAPPASGGGADVGLIAAGAVTAGVGLGVLVWGLANATDTSRCVSGCDGVGPRTVHVPASDAGIGLAIGGAVALAVGVVLIIVGASSGGSTSSVALTSDGIAVQF